MVRHGPAHSLITAVLLDVCNPLLTLGHDLNPFQVKMFVYDLEIKTIEQSTSTHQKVKVYGITKIKILGITMFICPENLVSCGSLQINLRTSDGTH